MAMKDARALLEFKLVYGSARDHVEVSERLREKHAELKAADSPPRALENVGQERQLTKAHIKRCIAEYETIKKHKAVKAAIAEGGEAKEWADYLDALTEKWTRKR